MLVVAMASQKGGSGKTTLSGHLAVEAEKSGAGPVALIDTDPQGSIASWWNARVEKTPAFAKVGAFDLQSALQHLERSGIRLAIIDTPAAITDAISHVIAHADLVIVPCRPSPHDLRAVGATVDLVDRHKKPLIFVVNAGTLRARITGEAAIALSQHGTVAPITIHHRVDFAASMVDGRTVGEVIPNSQSAKEITDLWLYIQDRLARIVKDPTLAPEQRPDHFSVGSMSPVQDEPEVEESAEPDAFPPQIVKTEPVRGGPVFPSPPPYVSPKSHNVHTPPAKATAYTNPTPYAKPTPATNPMPFSGPTPPSNPTEFGDAAGYPNPAPNPNANANASPYSTEPDRGQQPYTNQPPYGGPPSFGGDLPLERRGMKDRRKPSAEVPLFGGPPQRPSSTFGRRSTD
jgi:chromosome partitioning protein